MKKYFIVIFILAFMNVSIFSEEITKSSVIANNQGQMPEKMKKSVLVLRDGVLDLGDETVEGVFLNKDFIKKEQLDGTFVTVRYGKSTLKGNTYKLIIEKLNSDEVTATIIYTLIYNGKRTSLDSVYIEDRVSGQKERLTKFDERVMAVQLFNTLLK